MLLAVGPNSQFFLPHCVFEFDTPGLEETTASCWCWVSVGNICFLSFLKHQDQGVKWDSAFESGFSFLKVDAVHAAVERPLRWNTGEQKLSWHAWHACGRRRLSLCLHRWAVSHFLPAACRRHWSGSLASPCTRCESLRAKLSDKQIRYKKENKINSPCRAEAVLPSEGKAFG